MEDYISRGQWWRCSKTVGRPNILDDHLIRKFKGIAIGNWQAGDLINRGQMVNIAKGFIRTSNPDIPKEFSGIVELTNWWMMDRSMDILKKLKWFKLNWSTSKVKSSPQLVVEEKFTLALSTAISCDGSPDSLVLNIR